MQTSSIGGQPSLEVRRARFWSPQDCLALWSLRNCLGESKVELGEHFKWWCRAHWQREKLLIGLLGGARAGYVRESQGLVSVAVARWAQQQGLGKVLLETLNCISAFKLHAHVDPTNVGSVRLFESCGYQVLPWFCLGGGSKLSCYSLDRFKERGENFLSQGAYSGPFV